MLKPWIRLLVTLITLATLLYLGRRYLHELPQLREAHWVGVSLIAGVHLLTLTAEAVLLAYALSVLRQPLRLGEALAVCVVGRYTNLVLPKSGIGFAAAYLKRTKRVALAKYGSFLIFNASIFVLTCAAVALLVALIDWWMTGSGNGLVTLVLGGLLVAGLAAIFFRWRPPRWYRGPGAQFFQRIGRAWIQLGTYPVISTVIGLHLLMICLRAVRLQCAFYALAVGVSGWGIIQASLLGDLVFVVSFTPTALGLREAALVCVADRLGTTAGLVLSAAMLDRIVFSLTTIIAAQIVIFRSLAMSWWSGTRGAPSPASRPGAAPSSRSAMGASR